MNQLSTKQPRAIIPLSTTEMWERFGFYIVQGLLILFVTNHFQMSDRDAVLLTGVYGALVYISPLIGGYFADKHMGFYNAVLFGGCAQFIGYCLISTLHPWLLYLGLSTVILGNGFLKPNIASFLGEFYEKSDPRRHAGFTYYYMLMNVGQFLSSLSVGFIQQSLGWQLCFITAAIGMLIGLTIFITCRRSFDNKGRPPQQGLLERHPIKFLGLMIITIAGIVGLSDLLLQHAALGNGFLLFTGIIILISLLVLAARHKGVERRHLFALIWLILFAVVFWAFFFEMFSVINLFVERNVNRVILGIKVPPIAFISLESVFIVLIGWPLARLWHYLNHIKHSPNIAFKFVLSLIFMAAAMGLLSFAVHTSSYDVLIAPIWMVIFYFLVTTGEMLLSPNLLSAVTELSPIKLVGLMMGVQYLAIGFGSTLTGLLGLLAAVPKGITNIIITNHIYAHAFNVYAMLCLLTAAVILLCTPFIKKLMAPATS